MYVYRVDACVFMLATIHYNNRFTLHVYLYIDDQYCNLNANS